jgi:hypothetical protein
MTIKEWAIDYCYQRGIFQEQAEIIINNIVKNEIIIPWDTDINKYDDRLKIVLAVSINAYAIEYIEKECPKAWFKELFR